MQEKKFIQALGFKPKENTLGIFHKKYNNYIIEIDFEKKQFDFGNKITAGRETTQNFSRPENWVILECVDRLLEKGYKPENIILEKKYTVGHGPSGGWLDILVTREDGSAYLMIECKTWGVAFEKEFKKTEKDGGQLMTYFQQDKSADILMLYTSKLDKNKVQFRNEIIKIEDHYRQAGNVEDVFDRWNKVTNTNGIFDDWVKPYLFESKKLINADLKDLTEEDSKKIFHEFLSILRKHSVSDKPNAFNKIFNLFLAKIFDEKKRGNKELDFQWKEHKDNAVDFQIRLLDLYKGGMKDFLEKEIRGISNDLFKYETDVELYEKKKHVLLLDKNFDIKEVFDEETFDDNHRVLKEVVQLLQRYRIRYPRKQQHLSDFFERLLTTGLKQEAGQFFTPPPITRFIVRSLPISQYIKKQLDQPIPELPAVIDYSVGSGHFLTEIMEEYQRAIEQDINTSKLETQEADDFVEIWRKKKYDWASKYIYGIEKDYRLVKVAKVGCYFYGDGLAQIIHGDGLDSFKHSKSYRGLLKKNADKPQFSFIVSNPPYSVSSFKGDLKNLSANQDFNLFDGLTDRSSEIECLFIERTKQLLKTDGIAAIILPSSILSNAGVYAQARAIILKSFDIIAITELGSATFMATGTNTVTLFLKRREDSVAENVKKSVTISFTNTKDNSINDIEKPIEKYLSHVWKTISFEDYRTLLQKNPNEAIKQHEIFKEYDKKIKAKKEVDQWTKILEIEKEKLLYFILTYNQKVVLVKTGQKAKEKQFLGYEFSNRRGSEGMHPIQRSKTIDECTQLYDISNFENENKASTYIYKAFTENKFDLEIPKILKENVSYQNLIDMFTFDRANFEQNISLSVKKKVTIESRWELKRLGDFKEIDFVNGFAFKSENLKSKKENDLLEVLKIGNINREQNTTVFIDSQFHSQKNYDSKVVDKGDLAIALTGATVGKSGWVTKRSLLNQRVLVLKGVSSFLKYISNFIFSNLFYEYSQIIAHGNAQGNLSPDEVKDFKIPQPPLDIQQKIVNEIEVLGQQEQKAILEIESLKEDISTSFKKFVFHQFPKVKIGHFAETSSGGTPLRKNYKYYENATIPWLNSGEVRQGNIYKAKNFISEIGLKKSSAKLFPKNTVLIAMYGATGGQVGILRFESSTNQAICGVLPNSKYLPEFLFYHLKFQYEELLDARTGVARNNLSQEKIKNFEIFLPPLSQQQKVVSEMEKLEQKITELEKQIAQIPKQKEAILKKYLE